MKRINILLPALASLALISCQKEESKVSPVGPDEPKKVFMTFSASSYLPVPEDGTKTTMDSSFIYWATKDEISVFDTTGANNAFSLTKGAGSNSGEFSGLAVESDRYYAVYPYSGTYVISDSTVSNVTLPSTQTIGGAGYVDPLATLMVAKDTNNVNLKFHNLVSYIKVTPEMNCNMIVIRSNDSSEVMAGTGSVRISLPLEFTVTTETKNSVALTGKISAGNSYYIAVLPGTYSKGLEVEFYNDTASFSIKTTNSRTLVSGTVYNANGEPTMKAAVWSIGLNRGTLSNGWDYVDDQNLFFNTKGLEFVTEKSAKENWKKNLNSVGSVWLEFSDVDSICKICTYAKEIFTTPNSSCEQLFSEREEESTHIQKIVGFDKVHFIGVTHMGSMFYRCTKLEKIDLSNMDFSNCSNTSYMFGWCESLTTITGMEAFSSYKNAKYLSTMFRNCYKLDSLDLSGVKTIDDTYTTLMDMFATCSVLKTLKLSPDFQLYGNFHNLFYNLGNGLTGGVKCTIYGVTDAEQRASFRDDSTNTAWSDTRMQFAD